MKERLFAKDIAMQPKRLCEEGYEESAPFVINLLFSFFLFGCAFLLI
jgi:hypothetical protein